MSSPLDGLTLAQQVLWWRKACRENPELAQDLEVLAELGRLDALLDANPLQLFEPHAAQLPFFEATTPVVAAFAGNRFGKTTSLVLRALIECVDRDALPAHLQRFKRWDSETAPRGTFVRMVNPSFQLLEGVLLPAFRQWAPREQLWGGSFDKAFQGAPNRLLRFANGSSIQFLTYEMDLDKFGGWKGHVMGYDEPPPQDIRDECMFRLADFDGYEMFAMTPLKANTGWIRSDIYKKREHPDITVVRGSIHDNPTLSKDAVARALENTKSDLWRAAREFGDFVDVGGLIFPEFERCVLPTDRHVPNEKGIPLRSWVSKQDIVVGIDPGVRNCGITFHAFDSDNVMGTFDELLLQDQTPSAWDGAIRKVLKRWGVRFEDVSFVIDPASRQRSQVNAETVESALHRLGIHCTPGQNDVEAGCQQWRDRMVHARYWCSKACVKLRDEADEYAAEDRDDGIFRPIKHNDHELDSARYVAMHRPWFVYEEQRAPEQTLGFTANFAPPARLLRSRAVAGPPMGEMS